MSRRRPRSSERERPSVRGSELLRALSSAVLALPALAESQETDGTEFSYRYSFYNEDATTGADAFVGEGDRYEIDIHQLQFETPVGEQGRFSLTATNESMSGSSPWFLLPDPNGEPVQVLSGATIVEERYALSVAYGLERDRDRLGFSVGLSDEDDYESLSAGFERAVDLSDRHSTVGYGFSVSADRLAPTDAALFGRIARANKHHVSGFLSFSRVIDRDSVVQAGVQLKQLSGFLSDPYKQVFVVDGIEADARPDERLQASLSARYRRFFERSNSALHLDYRLFLDDWSMTSHTLDLSWHKRLGADWQIIPGLRYYSQSEADFYAPVHTDRRADGHHSSDYRLSGFGAVSGLLTLRKRWGRVEWVASAEYYESGGGLSLSESEFEHPGLIDFTRFSIGLDYRF